MKPGDKSQDQQQELIPLAIGEFLKHHRLEKKLTLATIAEAVKLDEKLLNAGNAKNAFRLTQERVEQALKRGGRVIVFRMLDKHDWDAPWSLLPSKGVSKQVLAQFFSDRYRVLPMGELAQIKVWELKPL